jgi:hypothetical protein
VAAYVTGPWIPAFAGMTVLVGAYFHGITALAAGYFHNTDVM